MSQHDLIIPLLSIILFSCSSSDADTEAALNHAGDNRASLEYVLNHYSNDTLKLKCAEYLISNSLYYHTLESVEIDSIENILSNLSNTPDRWSATERQLKRWGKAKFEDAAYFPDVRTLSAGLLTENIDAAVATLSSRPWNRELPFKDFCQLVLPYRISNERLSDWRKVYAKRYGCLLDSAEVGDDVLKACVIVLDAIAAEGNTFNGQFACPHHSAVWLFNNRVGNCRDYCDRLTYAMRACGIPVTTDHILGSPENGGDHQWMTVRDNITGRFIPFDDGWEPNRDNKEIFDAPRLKGKVYRQWFGSPGEASAGAPKFMHPEYTDVTAEYFGENEARVRLEKEADNVWLGVFSNGSWHAIGKGESVEGYAVFRDIEPGVFYAALTGEGQELSECSYPFVLLTDGTTHVYKPEQENAGDVRITRKRMLNERMLRDWMHDDMAGCRVELLNSNDSGTPLYCHKISAGLTGNRLVLKPCNAPVRYLRYSSPSGHITVGEITAYSGGDPIAYRVISPDAPDGIDIARINDGRPDTYLYLPEAQSLLADFGKPVRIDSILIVPRNDDNFIWPGDSYELLVQEGAGGWKSAGVKTAADTALVWDTVPSNALLWLRDMTRGHEEQPFIIKDGEQWFTLRFRIKPYPTAV